MKSFNLYLLLSVLSLLHLRCFAQSKNSSVVLYWNGGLPVCQNCGNPGQYACSSGVGKWNEGKQSFLDPGPASGYRLTAATATLYGSYGCSSSSPVLVKVELEDDIIDVFPVTGTKLCQCNTCDGGKSYATTAWEGGAPHYKYNSKNTLKVTVLTPGNSICLNRVELNLTFTIPVVKYINQRINYTSANADKTCLICNYGGMYSCNTLNDWNSGVVSFKDMIPKDNLIISAYAIVFGSFGFSDTHNLSASIQGILVGSEWITGNNMICNGCIGGQDLYNGAMYQTGWPNYN